MPQGACGHEGRFAGCSWSQGLLLQCLEFQQAGCCHVVQHLPLLGKCNSASRAANLSFHCSSGAPCGRVPLHICKQIQLPGCRLTYTCKPMHTLACLFMHCAAGPARYADSWASGAPLCLQGIPPACRAWVWSEVSGAAARQREQLNNYYEAMVHMGEAASHASHQIELVRAGRLSHWRAWQALLRQPLVSTEGPGLMTGSRSAGLLCSLTSPPLQ